MSDTETRLAALESKLAFYEAMAEAFLSGGPGRKIARLLGIKLPEAPCPPPK